MFSQQEVLAQQPLKFLHLRRQRGYLHGQRVRRGPLGRQLRRGQLITIRCSLPQPRVPCLQLRHPRMKPPGRVSHDRIHCGETIRTFVFTATCADPLQICQHAQVAHCWADSASLPDQISQDLARLVRQPHFAS